MSNEKLTPEEIKAELAMRRGLRAEVAETLVKFDATIEELEGQLAEAEKPKLRHGDYGKSTTIPWIHMHGRTFAVDDGHLLYNGDDFYAAYRLGNLIDEIKAASEDRDVYECITTTGSTIKLLRCGGTIVGINMAGHMRNVNLTDAKAFFRAGLQICATAERRQS